MWTKSESNRKFENVDVWLGESHENLMVATNRLGPSTFCPNGDHLKKTFEFRLAERVNRGLRLEILVSIRNEWEQTSLEVWHIAYRIAQKTHCGRWRVLGSVAETEAQTTRQDLVHHIRVQLPAPFLAVWA